LKAQLFFRTDKIAHQTLSRFLVHANCDTFLKHSDKHPLYWLNHTFNIFAGIVLCGEPGGAQGYASTLACVNPVFHRFSGNDSAVLDS
jgi:hypothetical protein